MLINRKMNDIILNKRTEKERVAYLVGKYFIGDITLRMLKIQINAIEEQFITDTNTSS